VAVTDNDTQQILCDAVTVTVSEMAGMQTLTVTLVNPPDSITGAIVSVASQDETVAITDSSALSFTEDNYLDGLTVGVTGVVLPNDSNDRFTNILFNTLGAETLSIPVTVTNAL
jgi:hypothetical protein